MKLSTVSSCGALALWACVASATAPAAPGPEPLPQSSFVDPLDIAAVDVGAPGKQPIMGTAVAGPRLIAVGMRGVIIASDDHGKTWQYQDSPVQSDLTDVVFPTATDGWAVGHDGVILHSSDGGRSWQKQLDGRMAEDLFLDNYNERAATSPELEKYVRDVELNYQSGPNLPWLGVWFEDAQTGYVVGPFSQLAVTHDGGAHWTPWLDRIDNPQALNLNAIRGVGSNIYIAGERGMVYRLAPQTERFEALSTGYGGSFFGVTGHKGQVLAFGLRGTVYTSEDLGEHWNTSPTPGPAAVTAGIALDEGTYALFTSGGNVWANVSERFVPLKAKRPDLFTSASKISAHEVLLGGIQGVQLADIDRSSQDVSR